MAESEEETKPAEDTPTPEENSEQEKPAKKAKSKKAKGKKSKESEGDTPADADSDTADTKPKKSKQGTVQLGDISEEEFVDFLHEEHEKPPEDEKSKKPLITAKTHAPEISSKLNFDKKRYQGLGLDSIENPEEGMLLDVTRTENIRDRANTLPADSIDETPEVPSLAGQKQPDHATASKRTGKQGLNPDEHPVPQMETGVTQDELNARLAIRLMETEVPLFNEVDLSEKVILDTESPNPIHSTMMSGLDMVDHAFFTRRGGVSSGEYFSLNTGFHARDERERVLQNRRLAVRTLNPKLNLNQLFLTRQRHTPIVHTVTDDTVPAGALPIADALVTNKSGIALGIQTADCLPVIFADPINHVVGIAHCGWRSAINGITTHTIMAMEALGAVRQNIYASLGPCISQDNYEVGQDLYSLFLTQDLSNKRFFKQRRRNPMERRHPMSPQNPYYFDLQGYVVERLRPMDIQDVEMIDLCTYGNEDLLFSHRRESRRGLRAGRQIAIVSLNRERDGEGGQEEEHFESKAHEIYYKVRKRLAGLMPKYEEYEMITTNDSTERRKRIMNTIKDMKERYGEFELEEQEETTEDRKPEAGEPLFSAEEQAQRMEALGAAAAKLKGNFVRKPRKPGANPAMASATPPPEDEPKTDEPKAEGAKTDEPKAEDAKKGKTKKAKAKKAKATKSDAKEGDDKADGDSADTPDTPKNVGGGDSDGDNNPENTSENAPENVDENADENTDKNAPADTTPVDDTENAESDSTTDTPADGESTDSETTADSEPTPEIQEQTEPEPESEPETTAEPDSDSNSDSETPNDGDTEPKPES